MITKMCIKRPVMYNIRYTVGCVGEPSGDH